MNDFLIWGMIFFAMGFALHVLRLTVFRPKTDKTGIKYYLNGVLHRENGPAVEGFNGIKEWYWAGLRHRALGPAIEYPDGSKEWWHHGLRTKVEWADGASTTWWEKKEEKEARREEFIDDI